MMQKKLQTNKRWAAVLANAVQPVIQCTGDVVITAAQTGEHARPAAVDVVAYNGGPLVVAGYDAPVYLDLDGITGMGRQLPLLRDHDKSRIVGTVTPKRSGNTIEASGKLVGSGEDRKQVEELAADGYAWQASVGARPSRMEKIKAGVTAAVNGATITGPAYIARQSRLAETSIVTIGADADTYVGIAATDPDDDSAGGASSAGYAGQSDTVQAIIRERARREAINAAGIAEINQGGDIDAISAMMNTAITAGTEAQQFELELLRKCRRPQGRFGSGGRAELHGRDLEQAVEASVRVHLGDSASVLEKDYPERVLNAMDRHVDLRHGLGLHDLLLFASDRNGAPRVNRRDYRAMLEGAFPMVQASGLSTISVSGILSAIANKILKSSFESVESVWREISEIESVKDFKTVTSYSLTGDMTYQLVPAGGELKHATAGEVTYTNRADTYGRMFALDRRDIVNDDLGALRAIPRRLGRGGALMLNDVFWAAFLDHASFFVAGNNNLIASGSSAPWYILVNPADMAVIQVVFLNGKQTPTVESADADFKQLGIQMRGYHDFGVAKQEPRAGVKSPAALDLTALEAANLLLLNQKDYDNKPLALRGSILLTSNANAVKAKEIYESTTVIGSTSAKNTSINPFAGMFRPLSSAYLPNS